MLDQTKLGIDGAHLHDNDDRIVIASSLDAIDLMGAESQHNIVATHIPNATPSSVIDFFLNQPHDEISQLTINQRHSPYILPVIEGQAKLPAAFRDAVNEDVTEYLEAVATAMARQTLNTKTGEQAEQVQLAIVEDIATTMQSNVRTAHWHTDSPKSLSTRQIHGHIGISDPIDSNTHEDSNRELEYLTMGKDDNVLNEDDWNDFMKHQGFATEPDSAKIEHTKTGDFVAFWGPYSGATSKHSDTLTHRTDPSREEPTEEGRRYSILMLAKRPPDIDYELDL